MPRKLPQTSELAFTTLFALLIITPCAQAQDGGHSSPLEIIHDKPFVTVMVNGKGPFRFVIDTGTSSAAFVSAELAAKLAIPQSGQIRLSDPSGNGVQKVPMVILDSLQVAGVEFTGVKAAVKNLGSGEGDCQGLLGFALFRDYLLTLDYPNRRMALAAGDLKPDGERSVLPFRMPQGIPVVTLHIGATRIDAQIDSGGFGLSLPLQMTPQFKFASTYTSLIDAHSLSTRFTVMGATLAEDVRLGSYTFKRPFVEINPAFPLANFGSCPMHLFVMTFDQKNGLVRLTAAKTTLHLSETPAPMRLQNAPDREALDPKLVPVG
ncbi:MAG: retropepsin-like aspartic protease [Terracidiphilus sp.]|jgi:predicted aspartyl protease